MRREIIQEVVNKLKLINGGVEHIPCPIPEYRYKTIVASVIPRAKFHTELNVFPTICLYPEIQTQSFESGNLAMNSMNLCARGIIKSAPNRSHLEIADLTEDINFVFESMKYRNIGWTVQEFKTTSIWTDSGIMDPFGICEVKCKVLYMVN